MIWLGEDTSNEAAGLGPNRTAVAPVRFEPVMVTLVPPPSGPPNGLIAKIAGVAGGLVTGGGGWVTGGGGLVTGGGGLITGGGGLVTGGLLYVNRSALLVTDVPPGVATLTLAVPDPAGEVAEICVPELTVTDPAEEDPKSTVVAPAMNPVPAIVTVVPPASAPESGLIRVTVGTGS
jgi:hypothetical protein